MNNKLYPKMGQTSYPKMGQSFSRDELVSMGTEMAGWMFDGLKDGGTWFWPDARVVLEKQGNRAVVIKTI